MSEEDKREGSVKSEVVKNSRLRSWRWRLAIIVPLLLVFIFGSYAGYIYAASPEVIRNPLLEHYHFRMQILVNGKPEDFGSQAYQTGYAKDNCNADLPEQPIHFHDDRDQFVHIHWEGMTGGMVLKYYGWNFIGGMDGALGYKLDNLKEPEKVTIHGDYLPQIPDDANFYVYVGDEKGYQEKSFEDFKTKDLEDFFGTTSNFPAHEINKQKRSFMDALFPKAHAHEGHDHSDSAASVTETQEEQLKRINNLIGNIVIFVQKDKPSDQQIKDRFNTLVPLTESSCGG